MNINWNIIEELTSFSEFNNKMHLLQNNDTKSIYFEYLENKFREHIISKIFDKTENIEYTKYTDSKYKWRNLLINENKRRFNENKELIDTKDKCINFLKKHNINKEPITKNWIKYCLGNTLFEEIKKQYYYKKEDILEACTRIGIYDFTDYKKLYVKDKMLPSIDYINNGFYIDMNPKFNLTVLLDSIRYDYDF